MISRVKELIKDKEYFIVITTNGSLPIVSKFTFVGHDNKFAEFKSSGSFTRFISIIESGDYFVDGFIFDNQTEADFFAYQLFFQHIQVGISANYTLTDLQSADNLFINEHVSRILKAQGIDIEVADTLTIVEGVKNLLEELNSAGLRVNLGSQASVGRAIENISKMSSRIDPKISEEASQVKNYYNLITVKLGEVLKGLMDKSFNDLNVK